MFLKAKLKKSTEALTIRYIMMALE